MHQLKGGKRTFLPPDISPPRHQAPDISLALLRTFPPFFIHSFIWPGPQRLSPNFNVTTVAPAAAVLYRPIRL